MQAQGTPAGRVSFLNMEWETPDESIMEEWGVEGHKANPNYHRLQILCCFAVAKHQAEMW